MRKRLDVRKHGLKNGITGTMQSKQRIGERNTKYRRNYFKRYLNPYSRRRASPPCMDNGHRSKVIG
jgi:hypothetical protein